MEIGKGFLADLDCPCSSPTTEITFCQALMGVSCPGSWDLSSRPFISKSSALREACNTKHVVLLGSDGAVTLPLQPASNSCLKGWILLSWILDQAFLPLAVTHSEAHEVCDRAMSPRGATPLQQTMSHLALLEFRAGSVCRPNRDTIEKTADTCRNVASKKRLCRLQDAIIRHPIDELLPAVARCSSVAARSELGLEQG